MYYKRTQTHLDADVFLLLSKYTQKCCLVSWWMLLQRPTLILSPQKFKPKLKSIAFDAEQHMKSSGCDKASKHVLYFIWPSVKRADELLNIRAQVIVRDADVSIQKRQK